MLLLLCQLNGWTNLLNWIKVIYTCYVFNSNEIWKAVEWHTFVRRVAALFIRANIKLGCIRNIKKQGKKRVANRWIKNTRKKHSFRLELCAPAAYNFQVDNMQINSFFWLWAHANGINDNSNANWNVLLLFFFFLFSLYFYGFAMCLSNNRGVVKMQVEMSLHSRI